MESVRQVTSVLILTLLLGIPAFAQSTGSSATDRAAVRPPSNLPLDSRPKTLITLDNETSEPLSEKEILRRLSQIYDYQSRILKAVAAEDARQIEDLLDRSMDELQTLVLHPEIVERPRFRELYLTVVTEYERYYGAPSESLSLPFGDILAFREEMFEAMNNVDEPLMEDVQFPEIGPVATTIPMTMNRLVQQSIAYLKRSPDKHLYNWLGRAETYFPMIEQILAEERMPDELKYLAMIESGLNPRARSWAAANGMWQFIKATGSAYGLETNAWVDERLDPEKSTRAAARHLRDLYELFDGDWHLALAGYNCSPGRIKRAMARAETRLGRKATFWDIYNDIPKETRNYVPMFIAASLVASNPEAFDINVSRVTPGPEYAFHYVPVPGSISINQIARLTGTDESTIRALNPEIRKSEVPPTSGAYYVRIPLGTYDRFAEATAKLPMPRRSSGAAYTVRRGDTLSKISRQYGVTVTELMKANDLRSTTLHVGQRLTVPGTSVDVEPLLADLSGNETLTVQYGRPNIRPIFAEGSSRSTTSSYRPPVINTSITESRTVREEPRREETSQSSSEDSDAGRTRIVYRVRGGDNLTDIARKYGVSVSDIRSWNSLRGSHIEVGQRLYLYESNPARTVSAEANIVYKVRRGDTLSEIARRHGVSMADIRRWNNLKSSTIRVGQRLTIHGGETESSTITYKVRRGDSLSSIAKRHGVTVSDLKRWNSLKSSRITPGQKLMINT